jgi:hypothetical protein
MRVQKVRLLHKFRVEYAESVIVEIGTWVSVLDLRDSLWVPEAAEVKPDETGSVVPGATNISWVVQENEDKVHYPPTSNTALRNMRIWFADEFPDGHCEVWRTMLSTMSPT